MEHQDLHKSLIESGQKQTFETYYSKIDADYGERTSTAYHQHRVTMYTDLIARHDMDWNGQSVIDFGCGDGLFGEIFSEKGAFTTNIDPSQHLMDICSQRLARFGDRAKMICGSLDALAAIPDNSHTCIAAFDVLDYLSLEDERTFYAECARILKKGGLILSSHSNELFDLYTFNRYTVDFFSRHFGVDVATLVTHPTKPLRSMANIRGNPLSHGQKVAPYGFDVRETAYLMHHDKPPLLMPEFDPDALDRRTFFDTRTAAPIDRWKLNFTCSVFGVSSEKVR